MKGTKMYTLNEIEEILHLSSDVAECIINENRLLSYLFKNRSKKEVSIDTNLIREILINHLTQNYKNREYSFYVKKKKKSIQDLIK